ncbi:helix-turn-helix transcriptional regulator [Ralstonia flatus]|uniref:Uncharacterized protein n=1 Tax=Ralstonia flatus TaxID=3058601 RepID=A0AAD2BVC0_9RALS|nr:transcriptional regulator [Ralstonia sp. LMG 32965]CAJ0849554.1 hypothetical protein R77567_00323 [Ralstonia sp. LMG 32965]CAJ0856842.1 hypothetical protein R77564_00415 [Ralstonia sp. LMG 32965]
MPMSVTPLARFDDLPNSANVDCKTVAALLSCTRTTVWRRSKAGLLPKPRKFGSSARWNVGELRAVLAGEAVEAK